jgi:DNA-binding MarR family transcriptional regulator
MTAKISGNEFETLLALKEAETAVGWGESRGWASLTWLRVKLDRPEAGISRTTAALIRKGLADRRYSTNRPVNYKITAAGSEQLAAMSRDHQAATPGHIARQLLGVADRVVAVRKTKGSRPFLIEVANSDGTATRALALSAGERDQLRAILNGDAR